MAVMFVLFAVAVVKFQIHCHFDIYNLGNKDVAFISICAGNI